MMTSYHIKGDYERRNSNVNVPSEFSINVYITSASCVIIFIYVQ